MNNTCRHFVIFRALWEDSATARFFSGRRTCRRGEDRVRGFKELKNKAEVFLCRLHFAGPVHTDLVPWGGVIGLRLTIRVTGGAGSRIRLPGMVTSRLNRGKLIVDNSTWAMSTLWTGEPYELVSDNEMRTGAIEKTGNDSWQGEARVFPRVTRTNFRIPTVEGSLVIRDSGMAGRFARPGHLLMEEWREKESIVNGGTNIKMSRNGLSESGRRPAA